MDAAGRMIEELERALAAESPPSTYNPPLGPCYYCGEPSAEVVNVAMNAHWSVPSRIEGVCRRHGLYPYGAPVLVDRMTLTRLLAEVKRFRASAATNEEEKT
jgi:hypothetical protein